MDMKNLDAVAKGVLLRAAQAASVPGVLCQGASERDQFGRDCRESKCVPVQFGMTRLVAMACAEAGGGPELWAECFEAMSSVTNERPMGWADDQGRTVAETVAKLREAAGDPPMTLTPDSGDGPDAANDGRFWTRHDDWLVCACGSDNFRVMHRDGLNHVLCAKCEADFTEVVWER